ncbi:MAG TPA: tetratricopeptide repeat protein, partial [Kiloniellales bacterium]|nr:tetratricopeptide repeat protein [Kiloniellales bacterium]
LSAQAAQLEGDDQAARRYFEAMLENPETRFLGLRGLLTQALRDGDHAAALDYAKRAYALRPRTGWVATTLFDLSERQGDLAAAEQALDDALRAKALPAPEAQRKRAVLLTEKAMRIESADPDEARKLARRARKLAPELVPATALLARLMIEGRDNGKAARLLEEAWRLAPHPELAALYARARPGGNGLERLQALARLTANRPDHVESHLALARAALEARLWGEARRHLKAAAAPGGLDDAPGETVCRLMAELEEAEHGDTKAARRWLTRAAEAPPDPAWTCRACGAVAPDWSARCGACQAFDSLDWRSPPRVLAGPGDESAPRASLAAPDGPAAAPAEGAAANSGETALGRAAASG